MSFLAILLSTQRSAPWRSSMRPFGRGRPSSGVFFTQASSKALLSYPGPGSAPVSIFSTSSVTLTPGERKAVAAGQGGPAGQAGKKAAVTATDSGPSEGNTGKIIKTLLQYVWPKGNREIRARVVVSLSLLVGAKALAVTVPFLFKEICDSLDATKLVLEATATGAGLGEAVEHGKLALVTPVAALLGYGSARAASAALTELRNSLFASVAQRAIRSVSTEVFAHLHSLSLAFHTSRQTGGLTRALDRGSRSIQSLLSSLVFNAFPTVLEIGMVTAILGSRYGPAYAAITAGTMTAYCAYTVAVTSWRTNIRRRMLRLENEASSFALDSLLGFETVKYFQGEAVELSRYDAKLRELDTASLKTQTSLSLLNFGQNAIFSVGLTASMLLAASSIAAGDSGMSVGDLVLINGLLFQLSIPLNFVGMVYRETKQALQDMGDLFTLLQTKPDIPPSSSVSSSSSSSSSAPGSHLRLPEGALPTSHPLLLLPPSTTASSSSDKPSAATATTATTTTANAVPGTTVVPAPIYRYVVDPSLTLAPALEFKNTFFSYPQAKERLILNGLDLSVPQGATVGVVGSTGCGKSTLLRLAFRLYDADSAPTTNSNNHNSGSSSGGSSVFVYGQGVKDVSLESLRGIMAVVPQDTVLFNDSIAANIAYGRASLAGILPPSHGMPPPLPPAAAAALPSISQKTKDSLSLLRVPFSDVVAAAKASHLHESIASHFPQGYDTIVGERGLRLSGGEKSRVAIARAFLKDSPILLCDEMTASLDLATEESVMRSLTALNSSSSSSSSSSTTSGTTTSTTTPKTMVLVAHRLSTVRRADCIFVLDKGKVVEKGTHQHLLSGAAGTVGLYRRLWERQQHEQEEAGAVPTQATAAAKASA